MSFAATALVAVVANGGSIYAAAMTHPDGVVAYENGNVGGADALASVGPGPVSIGGRLKRAGNGEVGLSFLRLRTLAATSLATKAAALTAAIGAADCGHLWTGQVATADVCNLPSNFGPGAGNWNAGNLQRLSVDVQYVAASAAGATVAGTVEHFGTQLAFAVTGTPALDNGNILLAFKNYALFAGGTALGAITIRLHYRHSMQS